MANLEISTAHKISKTPQAFNSFYKIIYFRFGSGRSSQRRSSKMFDMSHGDLKEVAIQNIF
jgi:hypothetical protein